MFLVLFRSLYFISNCMATLLEDNAESDRDNLLLDMIIDYLYERLSKVLNFFRSWLGKSIPLLPETQLELGKILSSLHVFISARFPRFC